MLFAFAYLLMRWLVQLVNSDLRRRDPDPELGGSDASPSRVLTPHSKDEFSDLLAHRGSAAGRDPPEAPLPPHQVPVPPKDRLRVTTNDDHRARERRLPSAAMNNRSRRRSRGLPTWRLRTISWWRRTASSMSLPRLFQEPAISRTTANTSVDPQGVV